MKKLILIILNAILACLCLMPNWVVANAEDAMSPISLKFALTSNNGKSVVLAEQGEVITVSFEMQRMDSNEDYSLGFAGFQNKIFYDRDVFELIEESITCTDSSATAKRMDSITHGEIIQCQNSGKTYASNFVFCTFQLKVLAEDGTGMVYNDAVYAFDTSSQEVTIVTQDLEVRVGVCVHPDAYKNTVKENEVAPTCTTAGSYDSTTYCTVCGEELSRTTETAAATGHTEAAAVVENNVDPTCTVDGSYDSVVYCTVCGEELSRTTETAAATGHVADEPIAENFIGSSCTSGGSYDKVTYCTVCKAELKRETISIGSIAHTRGEPVKENEVAPTCTVDGSYDLVVYCTICKTELERQENMTAPATGHRYNAVVTNPTCTTKGYTTYTCRCGYTYVENYVDALGHTEVVHAAVAATCTQTGLTEGKYCSTCNEVFVAQTVVDALGHDEVNHAGKTPTCTETGWNAYVTCSRCDYSTYVELPMKNHNIAHHTAKAPTCTEIGWNAYVTCQDCTYTTYVEISALGHDTVIHRAKEPTCTEVGWEEYEVCSRCDYTTYVEKAALGHKKVAFEAKEPTCTEVGWNAYEACMRCDYTTRVEKAKLPHDTVFHAGKAATCTEDGWNAYYSCNTCGSLFDATGKKQISSIPYLESGHTFSKDFSSDKVGHWYMCTVCGERTGYATHSGGEANCQSKAKCSVCNREYGEIDAKNHVGETYTENSKTPVPWEDGYSGDVYCSECQELIEQGEVISRWDFREWPWSGILLLLLLFLFMMITLMAFI